MKGSTVESRAERCGNTETRCGLPVRVWRRARRIERRRSGRGIGRTPPESDHSQGQFFTVLFNCRPSRASIYQLFRCDPIVFPPSETGDIQEMADAASIDFRLLPRSPPRLCNKRVHGPVGRGRPRTSSNHMVPSRRSSAKGLCKNKSVVSGRNCDIVPGSVIGMAKVEEC